jgi:hypothetical protein
VGQSAFAEYDEGMAHQAIAVLSFGDKNLVVVAIVQQLGCVLGNKQIGSHTIMPRPRLGFCGRQARTYGDPIVIWLSI